MTVTPGEFVERVVESMLHLTELYAQGDDGGTYLGWKLDDMHLSEVQRQDVLTLIRIAVGEATHCLISGLEGDVSLGGMQQSFRLLDGTGSELTGELGERLYKRLETNDVLCTQTPLPPAPWYCQSSDDFRD